MRIVRIVEAFLALLKRYVLMTGIKKDRLAQVFINQQLV